MVCMVYVQLHIFELNSVNIVLDAFQNFKLEFCLTVYFGDSFLGKCNTTLSHGKQNSNTPTEYQNMPFVLCHFFFLQKIVIWQLPSHRCLLKVARQLIFVIIFLMLIHGYRKVYQVLGNCNCVANVEFVLFCVFAIHMSCRIDRLI